MTGISRALLVLLMTLSLAACGGTSTSVKRGAVTGGGGGTTAVTTGKAKSDTKRKNGLTDADFTVRKIKTVKAPVFLKGLSQEGQNLFRKGVKAVTLDPPKYKDAAKYFEQAINKDPNFMEAYFNLGMTLERMGQREDALDVYTSALTRNPNNVSASAYIAKIYLGKARRARLLGQKDENIRWLKESKRLLDKLVLKNSKDVALNNAMALYFLALKDTKTAERYVKEVLYVQPTNVTGLNTRGLINLQRGKYLIAEWIFKNKVLKEDPNSTEALTNLGYTYIILNRRPAAMRFFEKALKLDPRNMDVRMNIAAMLLEHLNYKKAHGHYKIIYKDEPLNLEALEGLCDSAYGMGGLSDYPQKQFASAIACYLTFLKKKPGRIELYKRIAGAYEGRLSNLKMAVKFYDIYQSKIRPSVLPIIKTIAGHIEAERNASANTVARKLLWMTKELSTYKGSEDDDDDIREKKVKRFTALAKKVAAVQGQLASVSTKQLVVLSRALDEFAGEKYEDPNYKKKMRPVLRYLELNITARSLKDVVATNGKQTGPKAMSTTIIHSKKLAKAKGKTLTKAIKYLETDLLTRSFRDIISKGGLKAMEARQKAKEEAQRKKEAALRAKEDAEEKARIEAEKKAKEDAAAKKNAPKSKTPPPAKKGK